jgi:DNA-directed RNA polymerase specialized sigma subunit
VTSEHIKRRHLIEDDLTYQISPELIAECRLSQEERTLLKLRYIDGKDFGFIADTIGWTTVTTCRHHVKALQKIHRLIDYRLKNQR